MFVHPWYDSLITKAAERVLGVGGRVKRTRASQWNHSYLLTILLYYSTMTVTNAWFPYARLLKPPPPNHFQEALLVNTPLQSSKGKGTWHWLLNVDLVNVHCSNTTPYAHIHSCMWRLVNTETKSCWGITVVGIWSLKIRIVLYLPQNLQFVKLDFCKLEFGVQIRW